MVILPIELHQFCLEIGTDLGKDTPQVVDHFLGEHFAAVFCHKDKMNVHLENTMPPMTNIVVFSHRPTIMSS